MRALLFSLDIYKDSCTIQHSYDRQNYQLKSSMAPINICACVCTHNPIPVNNVSVGNTLYELIIQNHLLPFQLMSLFYLSFRSSQLPVLGSNHSLTLVHPQIHIALGKVVSKYLLSYLQAPSTFFLHYLLIHSKYFMQSILSSLVHIHCHVAYLA